MVLLGERRADEAAVARSGRWPLAEANVILVRVIQILHGVCNTVLFQGRSDPVESKYQKYCNDRSASCVDFDCTR